ncbi:acyltransferase family protein [Paenibacillus pedocola]|uniref:acyltransferase family protein n=1 Tax=Paenibacillus pedocola TaxID=3242193 RepID=UPI002877D225|nr:acyltransferase family protein [Paenibacillus typhae]
MEVNKRIDWIDIFKGLIILFVVIGHENGFLVKYVYLFHMPAFFFISGLTTNLNNQGFYSFTRDRFLRLIIPIYCINILFFLFRWVMNLLGLGLVLYSEPMSTEEFTRSIYNLFALNITSDLAGVSWFFIVLFLSSVLHKALYDVFHKRKSAVFVASILLFIIGYWYVRHGIVFQRTLFDLVLIAQFYFMCGFLLNETKFKTNLRINSDILIAALVILLYPLYYFANINWGGTDYPSRSFGNPIINLISAFNGIAVTIIISYLLININIVKRIFTKLGETTLTIALFHFLAFRICFGLLYMLNIVDRSQVQQLIPGKNPNYELFLLVFTIIFCLVADAILQKNKISSTLILGRKTVFQAQISLLLDFCFKPLTAQGGKMKTALNNKISVVIPYLKQKPLLYIFILVIIGYKMSYFMRPWINVNDELLILISSQKGIGSIYEYISNVALGQGRAYFLGNVVALIMFSIKNVFVFRVLSLLILLSNVWSFVLLCNKIRKSNILSGLVCFVYFVSLTFSWEPTMPNAYTTFYGLSITILFLSLRSFYIYIEEKQAKHVIFSTIGYILCLFTYELFIIFFPLYLLIALSKEKKLKKVFFKVLPIAISTLAYLIFYLIWRSLFGAGYQGATVDIASFSIRDCIYAILVLSLSAIPGTLFLSAKYRYILFSLYGNQHFDNKLINMIAQVFTLENIILGLLSFYVFYKLLKDSKESLSSKKMIALMCIIAAYVFLPSTLLAVTPLYQNAVKTSTFLTVNASYFSLFACILLFCLFFTWLLHRIPSQKNKRVVLVIGSSIIALACVFSNFQSNIITKHQNYLEQRLVYINSFIKSDAFHNIEDGAVIYAPSIFQWEMSLAIHDSFWDEYTKIQLGKNVHFTKELPFSTIDAPPLYYLKEIELDSRVERYIVFGKVNENAQSNDITSNEALVIYSGKQKQHIIEGRMNGSEERNITLNDQHTLSTNDIFQFNVKSEEAFTNDKLPGTLIFDLKGESIDLNSIKLITGQYESYELTNKTLGNTLATGANQTGWYAPERNGTGTWMGKEASVDLLTGQSGTLIINGYMTNYVESNEIAVLIDGVEMERQLVREGNFKFTITVPVDKLVKVTLKAAKTMIPADLNINSDTRELSVLINSIESN